MFRAISFSLVSVLTIAIVGCGESRPSATEVRPDRTADSKPAKDETQESRESSPGAPPDRKPELPPPLDEHGKPVPAAVEGDHPLLKFVPPQAFAAVLLDGRLLQSRQIGSLLGEPEIAKILAATGVKPEQIKDALLTAGSYTIHIGGERRGKEYVYSEERFGYSVAIRSTGRLDESVFVKGLLSRAESHEHEGKKYYVLETRDSPIVIQMPDEETIVFGSFEAMRYVVLAQEKPSAARHALRVISEPHDVKAVVSLHTIRQMMMKELELDPFRPEYAYLDVVPKGLRDASVTIDFGKQITTTLSLHGVKDSETDRLALLVDRALTTAPQVLTGLIEQYKAVLAPETAKPAVAALSDLAAALKGSKTMREGRVVSATITEPRGWGVAEGLALPIQRFNTSRKQLGRKNYEMRQHANSLVMIAIVRRGQITRALHGKDRKPYLSWRVLALNNLQHHDLLNEFNLREPWDSPHNKKLIERMPEEYRDPRVKTPGMTTFVIPYGPGTVTEAEGLPNLDSTEEEFPGVMIVQLKPEDAVIWTKPDDLEFDPKQPRAHLAGALSGGFRVAMSDHSVRLVTDDVSDETVRWLFKFGKEKGLPPADTPPMWPKGLDLPSMSQWYMSSLYGRSIRNLHEIAEAIGKYWRKTDWMPAVANYDDQNRPLLSWRVHLLPYMGMETLYDRFRLNEPWDSPHNKKLLASIPEIYRRTGRKVDGKTNYLVPVSDLTSFPKNYNIHDSMSLRRGGSIYLVEVDDELAVPWTKPQDLPYDPAHPRAGLQGNNIDGFMVGGSSFVSLHVIRGFVNDDVVRALFSGRGREDLIAIDLERVLRNPDVQPVGPLPKEKEDEHEEEEFGFSSLEGTGFLLDFSEREITKYDVKHLPRMRILESLNLRKSDIQDDQLHVLGGMKKLRVLDLTDTPITDKGLKHVGRVTSLEHLSLSDTKIGPDGMKHLRELTNLRQLILSSTKVGDRGVAELKTLKNLESLDVSLAELTDNGITELSKLPNLTDLKIRWSSIRQQGMRQLGLFKKLKRLELGGFYIGDSDFKYLAKLSNLEHLALACPEVKGPGLAQLTGLNKLTSLDLNSSKRADDLLTHLTGQKHLKSLSLRHANVTEKGLKYVGQMTSLEELDLLDTNLTDAGIQHLVGLKNLRDLGISGRGITDGTFALMDHFPKLRRLRIHRTSMTIEGYKRFQKEHPDIKLR